jgi:hydroxymethylpyrimidine pyrophosphatase-like HAD family hydrolase
LHPQFDTSRHPFNDPQHYRPTAFDQLGEVLGDYDQLITATLFGLELEVLAQRDWATLNLTVDYYPPSHYTPHEAVSVMSNQASKGNAVRWLRHHLKLDDAPTLCLGDSAADATMFDLGMGGNLGIGYLGIRNLGIRNLGIRNLGIGNLSIGVAPANASASVKEKAHWVAPHCDEGAVAAAVEKFVLASASVV